MDTQQSSKLLGGIEDTQQSDLSAWQNAWMLSGSTVLASSLWELEYIYRAAVLLVSLQALVWTKGLLSWAAFSPATRTKGVLSSQCLTAILDMGLWGVIICLHFLLKHSPLAPKGPF